ncbi:hypothetical protein Q7C_2722 (plasmid) [Methylophaga frappieri]|uniref:Uncharacterized protein n=1 Tax=Methylophaga frappieri (strain ATCC BAA-2434 / DSM 25690 / JAM7) TaxID=754477 RepID=I1YLP9_METFJ|nr:hypothetical protein Q7C_2722 [Methylophaga frappieri]
MGGHVDSRKMFIKPVGPLDGFLHQVGAVDRVIFRCAGMVVGGPGPNVPGVVQDMPAQSPGGEVERVATRGCHIVRSNAVFLQVAQVCSVELHRSNVMRTVRVTHPLARPTAFFLGYGQHNIGGHFIFHGSRDRAHNALLFQGWHISNERQHDDPLSSSSRLGLQAALQRTLPPNGTSWCSRAACGCRRGQCDNECSSRNDRALFPRRHIPGHRGGSGTGYTPGEQE